MKDAVVLVTGGTGGIGLCVARALALAGAKVVVTGRRPEAGAQAVAALGHGTIGRIEFRCCDHASMAENRELAADLNDRLPRLDILVNNAGGMAGAARRETAEGLEVSLATNALAPWLLTETLLPLLQRSASSRVITVVSTAFKLCNRDPLDDLESRVAYAPLEAYARAKLVSLLATLAWRRRLEGVVEVNAIAPPLAWTPNVASLTADMVPHLGWRWPFLRLTQRWASPEKAARRISALATRGEPGGAAYSGPAEDGETLSPALADITQQDRVWTALASLSRGRSAAASPR